MTIIDVSSHVVNRKPTDESDPSETAGTNIVDRGAGDFGIHARNGLDMSLLQQASANDVSINAYLPKTVVVCRIFCKIDGPVIPQVNPYPWINTF